jgi:arsenate reductase-like glutaredoxin family protein
MNEYSHNIVSDIAREYKNTETDLITVEKNFHNTPQLSLSDYVFYDYIKKELATTMLNTAYSQDSIDTNPYHNQIGELYEHLDEKLEIIDAYLTEYALRNQITP